MSDTERRIERCQAIAELLAQPDPPELRRSHHLKLAGKPERYELVSTLAAAFIQTKLLDLQERRREHGISQSTTLERTASPALRIVARRTAAA
jgi:hypothetical protein